MTKPVPCTQPWHRLGSTLALLASLGFALQPSFAAAQALEPDPSAKAQAAPPASAKTKKAAPKRTAADVSADELNRREAERTSATATVQHVPPPAAATEAPTVPAIPPRAPVLTASLTPDVAATARGAGVAAPPVAAEAVRPKVADSPAKPQQLAQARPTVPGPTQPPAPVPSTSGTTSAPPAPAPVMTGAPSRTFAQGQLVPTQQPTLTLEVNKGTAIKLSGAATTVFVAAPDIADVQVKSPTMIYVFAKKPGDTVLYAVDDQDRVLLNTIVSVTSPVSRMKTALDAEHPGNSITFGNQGEAIVLSGTARSAVVAEDARRLALQHVSVSTRIINNVRIEAPNQVQLRVKIAEVRRDALKRMGVNWQSLGGLGVSTLIGALNAGFAVSTASAVGGAASATARVQAGNFDVLLDFLATNNQATILAEPNLVAMSGESASFLAGGEIPVISPQAGQTVSTVRRQIN